MKTGIELVVGPPGAGKGLMLIQRVADILLESEQTIVTNFAIKLEDLSEWLHKRHPERCIDVTERIFFIPEYEEMKQFFLFRGIGKKLEGVTKEQEKAGKFTDYAEAVKWGPVAYILDEADIVFGAREWPQHGLSINFYNKQHRKLGDRVIFCCQDMGQLDANIRRLVQETTIMKNMGKIKYHVFKLPRFFSWFSYYRVPDKSSPALDSGTFSLPIKGGLENCFDTAAGVGMCGAGADTKERRKGLSPWWLVIPFLAVFVLIHKAPNLIASALGNPVTATKSVPQVVNPVVQQVALPSEKSEVKKLGSVTPRKLPGLQTEKEKLKDEIYLTGIAVVNGLLTVYLSDGTSFDERTAQMGRTTRYSATVDGIEYRFKPISLR